MADDLDVQLYYMMEAREGADGESVWHPALEGRVKTGGRYVHTGPLDLAPDLPRAEPMRALPPSKPVA